MRYSTIAIGILAGALQTYAPAPAAAQTDLTSEANEALSLETSTIQKLDLPIDQPWQFQANLDLDGTPITLILQQHSVRADDYQVWIDIGGGQLVPVEPGPVTTYRGAVADVPGSAVAASLIDGRLSATLRTPTGTWRVQPLPAAIPGAMPGDHVVYRDTDVQPGGGVCGVEDGENADPVDDAPILGDSGGGHQEPDGSTHGDPSPVPRDRLVARGTTQSVTLRLAFDADVEFYNDNDDSVSMTEADINSITNQINFIYERDVNLCHEIGDIIVRTAEPDPYTSTDSEDLLCEFRTEWNTNQDSIDRGLAHLMTGKNLDGNIVGTGYGDTVCNGIGIGCGEDSNYSYGLSASHFYSNMSERVELTAHMLGHNWGARHCNDSGNSCSDSPDCAIMCSTTGSCDGPNDEFNECSQGVIEDEIASVDCLTDCGCANVLYVDSTTGESHEDGSIIFPFDTVGEGVDHAPCGATLRIEAETYSASTLDPQGKTIVLEAQNGTVIIEP